MKEVDPTVAELEASFALPAYERSPEEEVYGRSLSTIHRLGKVAVKLTAAEAVHSPEAAQAKAEFNTSVEEGFGTENEELKGQLKVREFAPRPVVEGRVMSKDGKRAISDMTHAGLVNAQEKVKRETARGDRRFVPQLIRTEKDDDNALIVDKMVRGETNYNTRIVPTLYPVEAAAISGDAYWDGVGYVSHLQRGFFQVYHWTGKEFIAGSLSFDGGSKERVREILARRGVHIPETEVTDNYLEYAITGNFTAEEAKELGLALAEEATAPEYKNVETTNTVDVTAEHRGIMENVFNGSYIPACESHARGYQTEATRKFIFQLADKAHHFNAHYADALYKMRRNADKFDDDDMAVMHDLLVYSTIEMMRALHIQKEKAGPSNLVVTFHSQEAMYHELLVHNPELLQNALSNFAAEGAKHNRMYSACGLSISLGGEGGGENGPQSAFGGADGEKKVWMNCPNCKNKVFDSPCAAVLFCSDCMGRVVNGKVESKGDGGSRAKAEKQAQQKAERLAKLAQQVNKVYEDAGLSSETLKTTPTPAKVQPQVPVAA